ncbi:Putative Extracellular cellulase CelA/allergen Asp F7-like [Penicillium brasilianum]|uniref:Putative Extracellular cellulase CelA/allergen Asp F7-like n=1 Tax=Penicillium brasilianum TaxID=104259 RepID=A0A0F7TWI4_PENBI|nr:Putative Extracellular cellulase CelA/allergen Asp F7-like [Penicillium brasilianum]
MKYQRLLSLGAVLFGATATVSAKHLGGRHEHNQCPKGYTVSVYTSYSTVYLTSTYAAAPEVTSTSSPVAVMETPAPVETTTAVGDEAASTSSSTTSSTPVPTSEAPVAMTTQSTVAVVAELSTENAVAAVATSSTTSQETTSSASSTSTTEAAATATSSTSSASTSTKSSTSSSSGSTSGEATFYGGNVAGGTCSYSGYTLPSGLFGTAFSGAAWDNAAECGACVAVTGPNGNTIKAMIVDQCPECAASHLDLFQDAFAELSDISAGVIDITWEYTACDLSGPLKLKNKEGTSQYWFSMQVVNANEPVTKLEVSTDGGSTWQSTTRTSYNYFEQSSGFGVDTVDVRVTGQSGTTVVVNSVGCSSGSEITASSNL